MANLISQQNKGHFTVEQFYRTQQSLKLQKSNKSKQFSKENEWYFIRMLNKQL